MAKPKQVTVPACPICQCKIDAAGVFYNPNWEHSFFGGNEDRLNMHSDGSHFHFIVMVNGKMHHRYAFLAWRSHDKQEVPK